jgi:FG-GAP repeat protein
VRIEGQDRDDLLRYDRESGAWTLKLHTPGAPTKTVTGMWVPHLTLATGDLNGDGQTDLLLYDRATGAWSMGVARGAGRFEYTVGQWSAGWSIAGTR